MDPALLPIMVRGALADPILWTLAGVLGWNHRRAARAAAGLLGCAGAVWGAIRVAVYVSFGETVGLANAAAMVAVCVAAMLGAGFLAREIRRRLADR